MDTVQRKYRLLLVEDDQNEIQKIEAYVSTCADFEYLGVADCVEKAIALTRERRPDCVILDLELKGGDHGIYYMKARDEGQLGYRPDIMVLTNLSSPSAARAVHKRSSDGYFLKGGSEYRQKGPAVIIDLIREFVFLDEEDCEVQSNEAETAQLRRRIRKEFVGFGRVEGNATLEYLVWAVALTSRRPEGVLNLTEDIYKPIAQILHKDINTIRGGISYNVRAMLEKVDRKALFKAYTPTEKERDGAVEVKQFITYFANKYRA